MYHRKKTPLHLNQNSAASQSAHRNKGTEEVLNHATKAEEQGRSAYYGALLIGAAVASAS
jgi:hypothetical protein